MKTIYKIRGSCWRMLLVALFLISAFTAAAECPDGTHLGVHPSTIGGNPTFNDDANYACGPFVKFDPPASGTYNVPGGTITFEIYKKDGCDWELLRWSSTGIGMKKVMIKGGPASTLYDYEHFGPAYPTGDEDLHAPFGGGAGVYGISHVEFCYFEFPPPPPTPPSCDIVGPDFLCLNSNGTFEAFTDIMPPEDANFAWKLIDINNETNASIVGPVNNKTLEVNSGDIPGTFQVEVTVSYFDNGVEVKSVCSKSVTIYPEPKAVASNSGPVCYDQTVIYLNETGGDAVSWAWTSNGNANFDDASIPNPKVTDFIDGEIFTVEIVDENGCKSKDVTTVTVWPQPSCVVEPTTPEVCGNMGGSATVEISGGTKPYKVRLALDDPWILLGELEDSYVFTGLAAGNYTVYIEDANGCKTSCDVIIIEVPCEPTCESAWAKAEEGSICFIEDGFNNWGWTNPFSQSNVTHRLDLWADAGGCMPGTLVGYVYMTYYNNQLTVRYELAAGFTMDIVHIYYGSGKYPLLPNRRPTVAPGQYTYGEMLDNATYFEKTFTNVTGNIWVIAHAVVCGAFEYDETTMEDFAVKSSGVELTVVPNPFRDHAQIIVSSGADMQIAVEVYNINGARVAVLYEGMIFENDIRTINYEAEGQFAGTQFYMVVVRTPYGISARKILQSR